MEEKIRIKTNLALLKLKLRLSLAKRKTTERKESKKGFIKGQTWMKENEYCCCKTGHTGNRETYGESFERELLTCSLRIIKDNKCTEFCLICNYIVKTFL